ncbi:MAG: phosphate ABC transporter substrate-binding protein PstS [Limnoraphis sp. WC205]|jgi:phosphate transport system substrate-binding protein|nr:phosphate ABC transporter substrate-binding protein PstS [Limnoraphis sp. WC205]
MVFRLNSINLSSLIAKVSAVALVVTLAACGGSTDTATNTTGGGGTTPTTDGGTAPAASGDAVDAKLVLNQQVNLVGAGATFPAPLYQRWFQEFSQGTQNLQIDYQSVGSGAGVERFTQGLVQFGASDVAMTDEEIAKVQKGVLMLPVTAGSIGLAYNLSGVEGLKLSRQTYADIFLGKITNWNDPAIAEDNPGLQLPDQPITVVYRSDGSGTTGVFTKHMSAASEEWKNTVGDGKTVQWPVGIGGKGNEGVTAQVSQTPGAIGYIEYGYAKSAGIPLAALENKSGQFVELTDESTSKTLEAIELPEDLRAFVPDPEGEESYPIVSYTWLLVYGEYPDPEVAKSIEAMVEYSLTKGQEIGPDLGYIKLPQNVREKVAGVADKISPDYQINVN